MLGPRIDERHVLARLHHMGANIPADGTRSDNGYLPTHAFLHAADHTTTTFELDFLRGTARFADHRA
jgi:hypothetical protein